MGEQENIFLLIFKWVWNFMNQRCFVFFGHAFSFWDVFLTVIIITIAGWVIHNALDD